MDIQYVYCGEVDHRREENMLAMIGKIWTEVRRDVLLL
jgi:hypothetical protein